MCKKGLYTCDVKEVGSCFPGLTIGHRCDVKKCEVVSPDWGYRP